MIFRECAEVARPPIKIQIYSTDIDEDAIAVSRGGIFPANIAIDVSQERLRRFFIKEETGYRIKKEIREMVVFAVQDVIKDPPFTRLDLLSCRNLMIYFEPELQNHLIPIFHYALNPDGILFLSPSESIGRFTNLFTPIDRKWKFFSTRQSLSLPQTAGTLGLPLTATLTGHGTTEPAIKPPETNFVELTRGILLQSYAPPSVITNEEGNTLYVHGDTGNYLRPAPGQVSLNIVDMAREGLQLELRKAIHNAVQQKTHKSIRGVPVKTNGGMHLVDVTVRPIADPRTAKDLLIVLFSIIRDITRRKQTEEVINRLSDERKTLIDNVPAMIWYKDTRNNIIRVNPAGAHTIGLPVEAIEGKSASDLFPDDADNYYQDDLEVIRSGVPKFGIIEQMRTASGRTLWVRTEKIPLTDERGTVTGILVFSVDITDIKLADDELINRSEQIRATNIELTASGQELRKKERELLDALAEKEVLLSEIHHRVKNNLTAFISLLSLDASCEDTEGGRALRKDLQNRARSMALIHETLYRTGKFSNVDMEIYLTTLIGQIASSYEGSTAIRTNVNAQGVVLDLARATTAGLIINELVTNSFTYAFPPGFDCLAARGETCTIRVSFARVDGTYVLTVADNGLGLPAEIDPLATKSLGLKLVNFLASHQLRAEIEVWSEKGTEFIFRLNNINDNK